MAARAGVAPLTLRMKGVVSTNAPHMPHNTYQEIACNERDPANGSKLAQMTETGS